MPKNENLSKITAQIAMGAAANHFKCSQTMAADRKKKQFEGLRELWSLKVKQSSLLRSIKAFYAFLEVI